MLIDWLTLRIPLTLALGVALHQRILDCLGLVVCVDCDGVEQWRKNQLDLDKLRSDEIGIFWSIVSDGKQNFLSIGASPASLEFDGVNVFGSSDMEHCAKVLIKAAGTALNAILPDWRKWQCRRIDITANYDLGSAAQVKQALRLLLGTDAPRRRTNSDKKGGDSVYWNPSSDFKAGKAYHKGAHLRFMQSKGKVQVSEEVLQLADSLLRLELKLGSRWLRRLRDEGKDWQDLNLNALIYNHQEFFSSLIGEGAIEVNDMETMLLELEKVCTTKARALAAHRTFALMKVIGYSQTQGSMSRATFYRHCHDLRAAGLSSADLCAGKVLELRKRSLVLAEPVNCWADIRRAA
jgi:II/X family phage/plasmid replication protein